MVRASKPFDGRVPNGLYETTVLGLAEIGLVVGIEDFRKQVKRKGKELLEDTATEDTAPSPREETARSPGEETEPVQEICAGAGSEVSSLIGTEGAEEQARPSRNFGGRPRGSTLTNKKKREKNLNACLCAITALYAAKKKEYAKKKAYCVRMPNTFLKETIEEQKEAFGIPSHTLVSEAKIRSRENRASNTSNKGPAAPLASVEPALFGW